MTARLQLALIGAASASQKAKVTIRPRVDDGGEGYPRRHLEASDYRESEVNGKSGQSPQA
ncbi:hypothetical protein [Bosea sp. 2RAB26]|uniref:hypothetical protein n=1 Tax=Bosea sp. 2RAB26 TaxID=3237476 RepID=UPI003F8EE5D7